MVGNNLEEFCGKAVVDFDPAEGIKDLNTHVYRLRLDYDAVEEGHTMEELIQTFADQPAAAQCQELIIGYWHYDGNSEGLVNKLVELKEIFQNLNALFIGDITSEENEISWIQQSDLSPILAAFPNLELFQMRGGTELRLSTLKHDNLKTLIIETGGLPPDVVADVNNADLPNLEKLELWLGSDDYGFDSKIEDFEAIISGEKFPKLTYLGLKNSIIQDEIASKIAQSPILNQLHTLDMSMGILTDTGAQALLVSPSVKNLQFLNLDHHYMSEDMMTKIQNLGIAVTMDKDGAEEYTDGDGEIHRYVDTGE